MPQRNLEKERKALGEFGQKYGKLPKTNDEWKILHKLAYGADIPEELLAQTGDLKTTPRAGQLGADPTQASIAQTQAQIQPQTQAAGVQQPPATTTAPTQTTRTDITQPYQAPQLKPLQQQMESARQQMLQFQQPRTHLNVLQEAIKLKTGAYKKDIGESSIFQAAGLTGMENLSRSLNMTGRAFQADQATKADIVNNMLDVYQDMAQVASVNYTTATNQYQAEVERLQSAAEDALNYRREIDLLERQQQAQKEYELFRSDLRMREEEHSYALEERAIELGLATSYQKDLLEYQLKEGIINPFTGEIDDTITYNLPQEGITTMSSLGKATITGYGSKLWESGLDIVLAGGKGADINIPSEFQVLDVLPNNGNWGNQVKVNLGGNEVWFSHLDSINVKKGEKYAANTSIGTQGNTGAVYSLTGGDGTHVDITMPKPDGGYFTPQEVAGYLGIGKTQRLLQEDNAITAFLQTLPKEYQDFVSFRKHNIDTFQPIDVADYQQDYEMWHANGKPTAQGSVGLSPLAQAARDRKINPYNLTGATKTEVLSELAENNIEIPFLEPDTKRAVDTIAGQFRQEATVKNFNVIQEGYAFVNNLPLDTSNPADDQALIYSFAKAMDPNSVVREGEYATVQKYSQSWVESFGFDARRIVDNSEFLTEEARRNIKETILRKYESAKQSYDNLYYEYGRRIDAKTNDIDGTTYLTDYRLNVSVQEVSDAQLMQEYEELQKQYNF